MELHDLQTFEPIGLVAQRLVYLLNKRRGLTRSWDRCSTPSGREREERSVTELGAIREELSRAGEIGYSPCLEASPGPACRAQQSAACETVHSAAT